MKLVRQSRYGRDPEAFAFFATLRKAGQQQGLTLGASCAVSVLQNGGAGPEGSGRPVLSSCQSGEPRESPGLTAERWSQRQDPSPSGGVGAPVTLGRSSTKGEKR